MTRLGAFAAVLILVVSGCLTATEEPPLPDPQAIIAQEYADGAIRALSGSVYEDLTVVELAETILSGCERATVVGVGATAEEAVDARPERPTAEGRAVLIEVLAQGLRAACPLEATPVGRFLRLASPEIERLGQAGRFADDELVAAGRALCEEAGGADGAEAGVLALFDTLFGVVGASIGEISAAGALTEADGLLAGTLIAAAAGELCPEHFEALAALIGSLEP